LAVVGVVPLLVIKAHPEMEVLAVVEMPAFLDYLPVKMVPMGLVVGEELVWFNFPLLQEMAVRGPL
jgi:hypothetical protein